MENEILTSTHVKIDLVDEMVLRADFKHKGQRLWFRVDEKLVQFFLQRDMCIKPFALSAEF